MLCATDAKQNFFQVTLLTALRTAAGTAAPHCSTDVRTAAPHCSTELRTAALLYTLQLLNTHYGCNVITCAAAAMSLYSQNNCTPPHGLQLICHCTRCSATVTTRTTAAAQNMQHCRTYLPRSHYTLLQSQLIHFAYPGATTQACALQQHDAAQCAAQCVCFYPVCLLLSPLVSWVVVAYMICALLSDSDDSAWCVHRSLV